MKSSVIVSTLAIVSAAVVVACSARESPPAEDAAPPSLKGSSLTPTGATDDPKSNVAGNPTPMPASGCPADMVAIEGSYCPEVKQPCLHWLDPPGTYAGFRCGIYDKSQCLSTERTPMRFCIDRNEYTPPGEQLPAVHHSWTTAKAVCESQGKRLCLESEWQFACEGPDMHPYPYGDGLHRDANACNIDRTNLGKPNAGLRDLRTPAGSHPKCVNDFGVFDMSGNVEEWATLDHPKDPNDKSSMKGAWWLPGRNTCRAATTGHGETYEGGQVGVRCCANAS